MIAAKSAVFFVYVWPEPLSSAAGVRTRALMNALLASSWQVHAVSPSGAGKYRDELEALGVKTHSCDPNQSIASDAALKTISPSLVIFDRFVMEEQFGWRAREHWPRAFSVVDTQDLHSVRRAREALVKKGESLDRVLHPTRNDLGEDLVRELSSLYRADSAFVVSSWEESFLINTCGFPKNRILHLPFPAEISPNPPSYGERKGFCFLGNFRHPPNLDSVRFTVSELWPEIKKLLPEAELHLYGAYPPAEISSHKGKNGIFAHGPVEDHRAALSRHRALLAPLRFGAGIKGKVLEAWGTGTPVIGTSLTFEGMGGEWTTANSLKELAVESQNLYANESNWKKLSEAGIALVRNHYSKELLAKKFLSFVEEKITNLQQLREENLVGDMLRHHLSNGTKYFSRWIEAKNRE